MRGSGDGWVHCVFALVLVGPGCADKTTILEDAVEDGASGDGEPGDGDGEPGDGDSGTGDGDGNGDSSTGDGDGDRDPICDEIEASYHALLDAAKDCETDDQCHVVYGHCYFGLGGCWYVRNHSLQQADLDALAQKFTAEPCFGPICFCLPSPTEIGCVEGHCEQL